MERIIFPANKFITVELEFELVKKFYAFENSIDAEEVKTFYLIFHEDIRLPVNKLLNSRKTPKSQRKKLSNTFNVV